MSRSYPSPALIGLMVGLLGCQTFHVRSDWDPTIPFPDFQQYYWVEPPEREDASPFADNTLLRKRVKFAIENGLASRDFRVSESREDADFLVTYSVILEERVRVDGFATTTGGFYGRRYYGIGSIHSTSNVRAYQESTLIIDFLDPKNDDLVWRGWGTGIVRTRDRGRNNEKLGKGVSAILDVFPPNIEE